MTDTPSIKQGDRVRVTFEGEVEDIDKYGRPFELNTNTNDEPYYVILPPDATIELLPPEATPLEIYEWVFKGSSGLEYQVVGIHGLLAWIQHAPEYEGEIIAISGLSRKSNTPIKQQD